MTDPSSSLERLQKDNVFGGSSRQHHHSEVVEASQEHKEPSTCSWASRVASKRALRCGASGACVLRKQSPCAVEGMGAGIGLGVGRATWRAGSGNRQGGQRRAAGGVAPQSAEPGIAELGCFGEDQGPDPTRTSPHEIRASMPATLRAAAILVAATP